MGVRRGQLTPPRKMDEKLKSENMQKRAFLCYILRAIRAGRCRERRYADQIYSDRLQNAPFRSQIFENFLRLRRQGGIDPLTKILYL